MRMHSLNNEWSVPVKSNPFGRSSRKSGALPYMTSDLKWGGGSRRSKGSSLYFFCHKSVPNADKGRGNILKFGILHVYESPLDRPFTRRGPARARAGPRGRGHTCAIWL